MNHKKSFLKFQAPTTPFPIGLEIASAKDSSLFDSNGNEYLDFISGVAVNNTGHSHPKIVQAVKEQAEKHMHIMVYGEFIQEKPVAFCQKLVEQLPKQLNNVYLVNSGAESIETAIKLVKKVTGRKEIISFKGCYHGSTNGALSLVGKASRKEPFEPLLPNIKHIAHNNFDDLEQITDKTAGVFLETIQGDAGVRIPDQNYLKALREKCDKKGALLVFDEIQCGMGRTGKLFAFEHFDVVPDVLCLGKALGGGMPIGALISSKENLNHLANNPILGHITTFGGHPIPAAAGLASLNIILDVLPEVESKGQYIENRLSKLPQVKEIRRKGMMFAIDLDSEEQVFKIAEECRNRGVLTFWFLSCPWSFRLSPPLTISQKDLERGMDVICEVIEKN